MKVYFNFTVVTADNEHRNLDRVGAVLRQTTIDHLKRTVMLATLAVSKRIMVNKQIFVVLNNRRFQAGLKFMMLCV